MTTKVTIDAHAGWPVEVKLLYGEANTTPHETTEVVQPNTVREFYIHSGMSITSVRELERPIVVEGSARLITSEEIAAAQGNVADSDGTDGA